MDCAEELARTPQREDDVRSELHLQLPAPGVYREIGAYTEARVPSQETAPRFDLAFFLSPSRFIETDFRRPPEPPVVPHIGTDLGELWEVYVARHERGEQEFAELPPSATQLANGNMELPRMPSNPLMKPSYLCLHNGSTLRNSAAATTWEQKV